MRHPIPVCRTGVRDAGHCDCQFDQPTITLDGRPFVDKGYLLLLDDAEIHELAGKFGPADILLDPNPRLVLPPRYSR